MRDMIHKEKEIEINANKSYVDPKAKQKLQEQERHEQQELMEMIDGQRRVAKGADKMLKVIKTEQDLEPDPIQISPAELLYR